MIRTLTALVLLGFMLSACQHPDGESLPSIGIKGRQFVDPEGNSVLLNGVNLVHKNPADGYIHPDTAGLFVRLQEAGFNCLRLGVIWDGVEPEPGVYDEEYLDKIEELVLRALGHGVYVLLDMHQDLYGRQFSDGAPDWATITDDLPHETGAIWSDSYLISPAVQRAFDHFWANTPAPDGVGLQDHYAAVWKHIAERFAGYSSVLGYDIMNEPFNGSAGQALLPAMLGQYASAVARAGGPVMTEEEILQTWADEGSRLEALKFLEDTVLYKQVIDAAYEANALFETTALQAFYQRCADAIREVDSTHILFLEHAYFCNTGLPTAIEAVRCADGSRDPLVAYAAHGYDLVTDTKEVGHQSYQRLDFIFGRIHQSSLRMDVPVLVGEWGALHGDSDALTNTARHIMQLMRRYGYSQTYWAWYPGVEEMGFYEEIRQKAKIGKK